LSSASRIGRANGEVAAKGEAAVLPVTSGFEAGEALMSVGGGQTVATAVEEGFGEIRLHMKGMYGGIEVSNLILVLAVVGNIGGETPVSELFSGIAEVSVVGGTPLEEAEKPRP